MQQCLPADASNLKNNTDRRTCGKVVDIYGTGYNARRKHSVLSVKRHLGVMSPIARGLMVVRRGEPVCYETLVFREHTEDTHTQTQ